MQIPGFEPWSLKGESPKANIRCYYTTKGVGTVNEVFDIETLALRIRGYETRQSIQA